MHKNLMPHKVEKSNDTEEGYISVTGGKVWYKIVGKNQPGIPLLIVHGGPGASHDYLKPLSFLADKRPVIFYDQLGCGNSDRPDNSSLWTVEHFKIELHQIREALELKKVHILGQSWGTLLAVDYVLTSNPKGVISLILSGPLLSTPRWIEDQQKYIKELPAETMDIIYKCEETGDFKSKEYQDAMMEYYNIHVCRISPWPACLNESFEKFNGAMYGYMWGPSEFTVTGTLKNYDITNRLPEIKIPVLFTCGAYDEASPATTEYYKECVAGAEIFIFENASHEHHIEKQDEYLKVVRDFLKRSEMNGKHGSNSKNR